MKNKEIENLSLSIDRRFAMLADIGAKMEACNLSKYTLATIISELGAELRKDEAALALLNPRSQSEGDHDHVAVAHAIQILGAEIVDRLAGDDAELPRDLRKCIGVCILALVRQHDAAVEKGA